MFAQQLPPGKLQAPHPEGPRGLPATVRQGPGFRTARATSAARKDLLHGSGETLPLVGGKQERELGKASPSLLPSSALWVHMGIGKL